MNSNKEKNEQRHDKDEKTQDSFWFRKIINGMLW